MKFKHVCLLYLDKTYEKVIADFRYYPKKIMSADIKAITENQECIYLLKYMIQLEGFQWLLRCLNFLSYNAEIIEANIYTP